MWKSRPSWQRDHPRVCGEKPSTATMTGIHRGSPPRVRGKGGSGAGVGRREGITPACAGKSDRKDHREYERRDHPRVCGEKLRRDHSPAYCQGSPPRVRGKEQNVPVKQAQSRITPACAGKSHNHIYGAEIDGDHPRVCGEKAQSCIETGNFAGSPPRVRGKVCLHSVDIPSDGITPACAGKSHQENLYRLGS